jgi:Transposase DDE domain
MPKTTHPPGQRPVPRTFLGCLRDFLTPEAFKQARARRPQARRCRWELQPLVLVLLGLTWCQGDSQEERFETARAFAVACRAGRRRPGKTLRGWQAALARLPVGALRALADYARGRLPLLLGGRLRQHGFVPVGADGSRLECPRAAELETRLGQAGKPSSAPMLWLTALVHLPTGVPWAWRLGKGTANERDHLRRLLGTLPKTALVVGDAGFVCSTTARAVVQAGADFLIRMSSKALLYTDQERPLPRFREGKVYFWPQDARQAGQPALAARLIRRRGPKADVWLLTSVLCRHRLRATVAGRFYRMRWQSEGFFRAYKQTLKKVKLGGRTVRLVHREAEGSLLAAQLLLAQAARAVRSATGAVASLRKALLEVRKELDACQPRPRQSFGTRLAKAAQKRRRRRTPKQRRLWPRRKPHEPPKPPKLRELPAKLRAKIFQQKQVK